MRRSCRPPLRRCQGPAWPPHPCICRCTSNRRCFGSPRAPAPSHLEAPSTSGSTSTAPSPPARAGCRTLPPAARRPLHVRRAQGSIWRPPYPSRTRRARTGDHRCCMPRRQSTRASGRRSPRSSIAPSPSLRPSSRQRTSTSPWKNRPHPIASRACSLAPGRGAPPWPCLGTSRRGTCAPHPRAHRRSNCPNPTRRAAGRARRGCPHARSIANSENGISNPC